MKKIGVIIFHQIPEPIKTTLKIKEDTWFGNFSKSFCEENKINPENLEFDIIKDSDKIMLVTHGTEQPSESNKPARLKEVLSNVK